MAPSLIIGIIALVLSLLALLLVLLNWQNTRGNGPETIVDIRNLGVDPSTMLEGSTIVLKDGAWRASLQPVVLANANFLQESIALAAGESWALDFEIFSTLSAPNVQVNLRLLALSDASLYFTIQSGLRLLSDTTIRIVANTSVQSITVTFPADILRVEEMLSLEVTCDNSSVAVVDIQDLIITNTY